MHTDNSPRQPLNKALAHACEIAGGQSALACSLGRKQGTVWEWLYVSGRVPPDVAMQVEDITGIPAEAMNGDLATFAKRRRIRVRKLRREAANSEQGRAAA